MRTEGVYTYLCECGTFFSVVSRFSIAEDFHETLICPKCTRATAFYGEGFVNYKSNKIETSIPEASTTPVPEVNSYPYLLDAKHVSEIIGVSRRRAYEIMENKGFPLKRIGSLKRVIQDEFFLWLKKQ